MMKRATHALLLLASGLPGMAQANNVWTSNVADLLELFRYSLMSPSNSWDGDWARPGSISGASWQPAQTALPGFGNVPGAFLPSHRGQQTPSTRFGPMAANAAADRPGYARLNGVWQGLGGETVTISGNRFRMESGAGRRADGMLMILGNRLIAYCWQADRTCQFRYEIRGNMLAVAGPSGEIMLFKRVNQAMAW